MIFKQIGIFSDEFIELYYKAVYNSTYLYQRIIHEMFSFAVSGGFSE